MDTRAMQAMVRFGMGAGGEQPPPPDPGAWLRQQITAPDPTVLNPVPSTVTGLTALRNDRQKKPAPEESQVRPLFRAEAAALLSNAVTTTAPYRERLVWFWTNHFTVSARQGGCAAVAGAFVQEAIRPHVTGRFGDMLQAVMHHPAMLLYLDNTQSVGPESKAGQRRQLGLNENLARECMELHTLSPAAGYTQADVTAFAMLLTGWSIDLRDDPPGFRFRPAAHQPGGQTVLGSTFPDGQEGAEQALAYFAGHPATHLHLATKLVCHFVADDPPPDAVRAIEATLRDTGGDLGQAALALTRLSAAWQPGGKLRTPQDLVVAALRGIGPLDGRAPAPLGMLAAMGQPWSNAPQPNGWSDRAADWAAPEAMMRRVDWAYGLAGRAEDRDPMPLAQAMLGPLLRPETAHAIQHAGSRRDALTLLVSSPEFQRR